MRAIAFLVTLLVLAGLFFVSPASACAPDAEIAESPAPHAPLVLDIVEHAVADFDGTHCTDGIRPHCCGSMMGACGMGVLALAPDLPSLAGRRAAGHFAPIARLAVDPPGHDTPPPRTTGL